jgi:cell division protein FtsN
LKERTFYTINLDARRITVIGMILLLLLVYSFILGHSIGKRKSKEDGGEVSKTETTKMLASNRPTIKSDEESSLDAKEELTPKKAEVIDLNETEKDEEEEIPAPKPDKQTRKKKTKKPIEETSAYYTLQMGAFSSEEQAQKYKEKLMAESSLSGGRYATRIIQKGELHVVQMGKFTTRTEAESTKSKLEPKVQSSAIVQKVNR